MKKTALLCLVILLLIGTNPSAIAIQIGSATTRVSPPPPVPKTSRMKIAAGATIYADAVNGNDLTGDGSQGNPYKSVTAATVGATDGDTIQVLPGLYSVATTNESFAISLNAAVTLKGSGPSVTRLQGEDDWTRNILPDGKDIIDCNASGTTTIQDLTVAGCGNDAISNNQADLVIKNVVFDTCYDTQRGGGVYFDGNGRNSSSLSISGCTFTRNNSGNGGGDYSWGGAIYTKNAATIDIADCVFTDCSAIVGGAVFLDISEGAGAAAIRNCRFSGNTSNQKGGAIYMGHINQDGTNLHDGTTVVSAIDKAAIGGPWTGADPGPYTLDRWQRIGEPLTITGMVGLVQWQDLLKDTVLATGTVAYNVDDATALGGTWDGPDVDGHYTLTAPLTLGSNVTIVNDWVYAAAGSILPGHTAWVIDPATATSVDVSNCLITGNTAGTTGSAIVFPFGNGIRIFNNTIANNAGAATVLSESGDGFEVMFNDILWGNTGTGFSAPGLRNCAAVYSIGQIAPGVGNIPNTDPLFIGAGDYHLQPSSPALWPAGISNTTYQAPTDDLGNDARHTDGHVSMGAYEFPGTLPYTGN
jgi:predicted outer membrane repeat protein